jgi:hypothetical protein
MATETALWHEEDHVHNCYFAFRTNPVLATDIPQLQLYLDISDCRSSFATEFHTL